MQKDPRALLASVFGYEDFRPGQEEIVDAVLAGRDALAIMPTGGGKSLCYQLPALCQGGLTLVISPLIALMRDQVRSLREAGVEAGALTSGNTDQETDEVFDAIDTGRLRLLYMAPERLASGSTISLLRRAKTRLIAVDEAHCVSQWGHDFRPDYLRIGELRRALGVPLAAFTATADEETRAEIITRLFDDRTPDIFLRGFDRPNIHLAFAVKDNPRRQILDFAGARRGQSGIVYCATRSKTEVLARALGEAGHPSCHYHGGMDPDARRDVEMRFQQEDGLIVCATIAFGMGIDKPDIRWVAHADLSKSIEAYYQEIGRAGRDGAPAETLTLYGADDIRLRRAQVDESPAPLTRKEADHARLNALLGLAEATGCRRQVLLGYFGESSDPCGNCDLCNRPAQLFDATVPVRKALSAALRTGEWFGAGHLIDILTGNNTAKVREKGHDSLPTFGAGRELTKTAWGAVFRQMMGRDLLRPDPERFGGLRMTDTARPILRGEESVTLRQDTVQSTARPAVKELVEEQDAPLMSALKAKRAELARAAQVPAYVIFQDKTLAEMAARRPSSLDEMAQISGVGAKKLESYGPTFLAVMNGAAAALPLHPARLKIAGKPAAEIFDLLAEAQLRLMRGEDGTGKPMTLSQATLRKIAEARPQTLDELSRIGDLGAAKLDRFGTAFLEICREM